MDMSNSKLKNFNLANVTDYREITKILSKIAEQNKNRSKKDLLKSPLKNANQLDFQAL